MRHSLLGILAIHWVLFIAMGCDSQGDVGDDGPGQDTGDSEGSDADSDGDGDGDSDGDSDGDTDSDGDSDGDGDGDGDADADGDTNDYEIDTTTGGEEGEVCDESNFEITGRMVDILIVLDRSESMNQDGFWIPMGRALTEVTAATEDAVNFGLFTFPFENEDCSPGNVLIPIGEKNAAAIADVVGGGRNDIRTSLGTPTAESLTIAKDYLDTVDDGLDKYVILANDGAPNCNADLDPSTCECSVANMGGYCQDWICLDDQATYVASARLKEAGYPVFVLGIGESMQWGEVMDNIASAGGTGSYIPADSDQFVDVLMQIVGGIITCEFDVDWSSIGSKTDDDPDKVNFYCKGSEDEPADDTNIIFRDDGCASNGLSWTWTDDTHSRIQMCEGMCDKIKRGECPIITATFGCASRFVV